MCKSEIKIRDCVIDIDKTRNITLYTYDTSIVGYITILPSIHIRNREEYEHFINYIQMSNEELLKQPRQPCQLILNIESCKYKSKSSI